MMNMPIESKFSKFTKQALAMLTVFGMGTVAYASGLGFDKTRLIIDENRNVGSVVFDNRTDGAFFVRTHLEDVNGKKTNQGMARPPVFQVNPQRAARVQVVVDGENLPQDRESMFWLYTKAYPAQKVDDTHHSKMKFNYAFQMKVFYRPKGLQGSYNEAAKSLVWNVSDGLLNVRNESPFNISLVGLEINQKHADANVVLAPFSTVKLGNKAKKEFLENNLYWYVIDDNGTVIRYPEAQ